MAKNKLKNNKADANVLGVLTEDFSLQKLNNKEFLCSSVAVNRLSGVADIVPIYIPAKSKIKTSEFKQGDTVLVSGVIRSYPKAQNGHLKLLVKVYRLNHAEGEHHNKITVEGYLCKEPVNRKTPLGRNITDLFIAVNFNGNSAYLPAISWGSVADKCASMKVGDLIKGTGEFHSRKFFKKLEDGTYEERIVYECSLREVE